jgi:hypothetical protein
VLDLLVLPEHGREDTVEPDVGRGYVEIGEGGKVGRSRWGEEEGYDVSRGHAQTEMGEVTSRR